MKEFPLYREPCVVCGQPGLSFVPGAGVKHRSGWCRLGTLEWPPAAITPARPVRTRPVGGERAA